jgi:very-short-patch-repair endonuclease
MTSSRTRQLRCNQTEAERRLWSRLRDRQLAGYKFRRQVAFGPFIVDFICFDARLLIELDGGQHGECPQQLHDDERTAWLESQGYRMLRFWNNEVLENVDGVLTAIAEALRGR